MDVDFCSFRRCSQSTNLFLRSHNNWPSCLFSCVCVCVIFLAFFKGTFCDLTKLPASQGGKITPLLPDYVFFWGGRKEFIIFFKFSAIRLKNVSWWRHTQTINVLHETQMKFITFSKLQKKNSGVFWKKKKHGGLKKPSRISSIFFFPPPFSFYKFLLFSELIILMIPHISIW